ncbi:MAG TPA: hypothetical protein VGY49_02420 [Burkholderiaceae bacterium]|jgi:hypothetical protein|nr:hypothetical protein [Burkholderiaceae bacterium]
MARNSDSSSKPTFHTPMRFDWTDEKLQTLSQEQLLNLLENLDHQRAIGRISESTAASIDQRIASLLTGRNSTKRRKQLAESVPVDAERQGSAVRG